MTFLQYFLYISILITSITVISALNPITSIFSLILAFCFSTCLFISIGAEFLGFVFLMVYVGAIAILFLFVIMMLDIKIIDLKDNYIQYFPVGFIIISFFVYQFYISLEKFYKMSNFNKNLQKPLYELYYIDWANRIESLTNVEIIGKLLYTNYIDLFLLSSVILLIAMIGAIVLTLRSKTSKPNSRKQNLNFQLFRDFEKTVKLVKFKNKIS